MDEDGIVVAPSRMRFIYDDSLSDRVTVPVRINKPLDTKTPDALNALCTAMRNFYQDQFNIVFMVLGECLSSVLLNVFKVLRGHTLCYVVILII